MTRTLGFLAAGRAPDCATFCVEPPLFDGTPGRSTLLRRTFDVDALACAACGGRLRPLDVVADPEEAGLILKAAGLPAEPPPLARARDPTEE